MVADQSSTTDGDCEMTNLTDVAVSFPTVSDSTHDDMESSHPLLAKTKLSREEVASIMPFFMIRAMNFVRRRWMMLGGLIILITVLDVLIFFLTAKGPKIHNVEISFSPTTSDAEFKLNGTMTKSSMTTSFDVNSATCGYFYRKDDSSEYSAGGLLTFIFPPETNDATRFNVTVQARDTHYDVFRRISWDITSKSEVVSSVKLDCTIDISAVMFNLLSAHYPVTFSQDFPLSDFQAIADGTSEKKYGENKDKKGVSVSITDPKFTMSTFDYNLQIFAYLHNKLKFNDEPIDSFVVHLPKISYATALVDQNATNGVTDTQYYLKLRTKETTFDLADDNTPILIPVRLGCVTSKDIDISDDSTAESTGSCLLISPLNIVHFKKELMENGFMNLTTQSLNSHFISQFLGEYHYVRTVSPNYPADSTTDGSNVEYPVEAYGTFTTGGAKAVRAKHAAQSAATLAKHEEFMTKLHQPPAHIAAAHQARGIKRMKTIPGRAVHKNAVITPVPIDPAPAGDDYRGDDAGMVYPPMCDPSMPQDPSISHGADCVYIDSDGIYMSTFCTSIQEGFMKIFIGVKGNDGTHGEINWEMSWDPSGDMAMQSKLNGRMSSFDNSDFIDVFGSVFASQHVKKIQATFGLNTTDTLLMLEEFKMDWDFSLPKKGYYQATSMTHIDGMDPLQMIATTSYAPDNTFMGKVEASNSAIIPAWNFTYGNYSWNIPATTTGDTMGAYYTGIYNGTWEKW